MVHLFFKKIKWLLYTIIALLVLFSGVFALVQTKTCRTYLVQKIVEQINKSDAKLTVDQVEGESPLLWHLHNLTLQLPHQQKIAVECIDMEFTLSPLLGQLQIDASLWNDSTLQMHLVSDGKISSYLALLKKQKAKSPILGSVDASIESENLHLKTDFSCEQIDTLELHNTHLKTAFGSMSGTVTLINLEPVVADVDYHLSDLSRVQGNLPFATDATLSGHLFYQHGTLSGEGILYQSSKTSLHLSASKPRGSIVEPRELSRNLTATYFRGLVLDLPQIKFLFQAEQHESLWSGHITASQPRAELTTAFSYSKKRLVLQELLLKSCDNQLSGSLEIDLQNPSAEGNLSVQLGEYGIGNILLDPTNGQTALIDLSCHNLNKAHLHIEDLTLKAHLFNLRGRAEGSLSLTMNQLKLSEILFSSIHINSSSSLEGFPFTLTADGFWKKNLHAAASGVVTNIHTLILNDLCGELLEENFALKDPCMIRLNHGAFSLSPSTLLFGEGSATFCMTNEENLFQAEVRGEHLPLDLFGILEPRFPLKGKSSFEGSLSATASALNGRFSGLLESADFEQIGKERPLKAKGSLQVNLSNKTLQIHTSLLASQDQFLTLSGTIPIDYTMHPFSLKIAKESPVSAEIVAEGKLEEIFDFVNLGSHQLHGVVFSHLLLSNTLNKPILKGSLTIHNGLYENSFTGTFLKEIHGECQAYLGSCFLTSFSGVDEQGGSVEATGELTLDPQDHYPFTLQANLSNLNYLRSEALTAHVTGQILISGDLKGAAIDGDLEIKHADLPIPDELPVSIPELPVTYVYNNQKAPFSFQPQQLYPCKLDLTLHASGSIFVHGRGLFSEWQGQAHVTGDPTELGGSGQLTLISGEYLFAGKAFKLTQGEIHIRDGLTGGAYLTLQGQLDLPSLHVTAMLQGPLSSPRLTFQSAPHLPTSSILSMILFNKEISEITPFQAIHIAQTIVSLSGGTGPDVLAKIRKSLGVDRLNIVSSPTGSDEVSVQIGKYLTRGVMVTLSQGLDTSHVIVEVDLKKGFIFQAETQEQEEGKFTLKWNRNY